MLVSLVRPGRGGGAHGGLMAFAGLWKRWTIPDGIKLLRKPGVDSALHGDGQKGYRIEVDSRKVIASAKVNDVSQSQSLARFFDQVLVEQNKPAVWEHPTE